jgi:membrane-bound serine protease (ClpP class)
MVLEVLEQCLLGRQRAGADLRFDGIVATGQHGLLVVERRRAEHRGQPALAFDLDDERRETGARRHARQRRCDGGFADATLPGHDDEPRLRAERDRIQPAPSETGLIRTLEPGRRPGGRAVPASLGVLVAVLSTLASAAPVSAVEAPSVRLDVIEVSGLLDPVLVDFVDDALDRAERQHARALVIQMNSSDAVVDDAVMARLAGRFRHSRVPVAVWIGPSGARVDGSAAALLDGAVVVGMAPGTRLAGSGPADALRRGVVDVRAAVLGEFIQGLDGTRWRGGRIEIPTENVSTAQGPGRRLADPVAVHFSKLPFVPRLLHTVASPSVAFLLLLAGLLLVAFEFFAAGVGIAATTGAGAIVLSAYGLGTLPAQAWAVALVGVAVFGFSVDVQAGAPRAWTVIGAAALAVGSANLYDGLSVGLLPLAGALLGAVLFMVAGVPATVRARFSTPTIGRESMVGEAGTAVGAVHPEGVVRVRGALWRARASRTAAIAGGDPVRVTAVEGVVLRVEPASGEIPARPN